MGISGGKWQGIRAKVLARDRGVCYLCDGFIPDGEAEVDHLVELAEGGTHDLTNLASCCRDCPARRHRYPDWAEERVNAALRVLEHPGGGPAVEPRRRHRRVARWAGA